MKQDIKALERSFDNESSNYDENTISFHHKLYEFVLLKNLEEEELEFYTKSKILDAGCGTGNISLKLLRKGLNISLLDISSKSIEIAKKKIEAENIKTAYYVNSCEETSFKNTILCCYVKWWSN